VAPPRSAFCFRARYAQSDNGVLRFESEGLNINADGFKVKRSDIGSVAGQSPTVILLLQPTGGFAPNVNVLIQGFPSSISEYVSVTKKEFDSARIKVAEERLVSPKEWMVEYAGTLSGRRAALPEVTAEKFITNPLPEEPGERLYRTGDLARWWPTASWSFGSDDQQVKIRGCRIELGEIESVLRQHEQVEDCVVLAREDRPGDKRLVAYLIVRKKAEPNIVVGSFRSSLKSKLPDYYMIPPHFVVLESLPLTPNGRFDLKTLPEPELDRTDLLEEYIEPLAPMEKHWRRSGRKYLGQSEWE
jgi:acyl-CoA synthetase (AMP-forming)/AMP-acid ligase II